MGDWLSMEMRKKQKTLIDLFFRFIVLFCINILLIFAGAVLLLMFSVNIGLTLPANRAETELAEYVTEIQAAGLSPDAWIPKGCTYGIYSADGTWLKGDFFRPGSEAGMVAISKRRQKGFCRKLLSVYCAG